MKIKMLILVSVILIFSFLVGGNALAQNENTNTDVNTNTTDTSKWEAELDEINDVSVLPGSMFYPLKMWWEDVEVFFTFDNVKKAEKLSKQAMMRLVEAKKLTEKGKDDLAEKHLDQFKNYLQKANDKALKAKEKGKDVDELIAKLEANSLRHQEVLSEVYEKVPEQAKEAILNAMENSSKNTENVINKIQKSGDVSEFKLRIKNKLNNLKTNTANEIREELKVRGILDNDDSEDDGDLGDE